MHELALAESIARIVQEHAAGRRVRSVRVRVGALRQVVPSALVFGFAMVARETGLGDAALEIEEVPVAGRCRVCGSESPQPGFPFRCPTCGRHLVDVIRGEELLVESLELDEGPAPRPEPDDLHNPERGSFLP